MLLAAGLALLGAGAGVTAAEDPAVIRTETMVVEGESPPDGNFSNQVVATPLAPTPGAGWDAVTANVPNLEVETAGSSSFGSVFTLRGLANTPYFSDPSVALYFDDIPIGGSFSYPTDLFGIASATVFLGPQSAGFGRAAEGGVIVLNPSNQVGVGELSLGYGSFNSHAAGLVDDLREAAGDDTAFALSLSSRNGYVENIRIGERVDDLHEWTSFARQRLRPTRSSELTLEFLADRHHDGAAPLVPLSGPLFSVDRAEEGETDSALYAAALKGAVDTGIGRLTATTSYSRWSLNPYKDWLVLPPPLLSYVKQSQSSWNEELRLSSQEGAGPSWTVGSWLSEGPTEGSSDRSIQGTIPIEVSGYRYTRHEAAFFGQTTVTPVRGLRISVEARAQSTAKDYTLDESVPKQGLNLRFRRNDRVILPKVSAAFDLAASTEATLSISAGSKPGGYAAYTDNPALIPFSSESVVATEGGIQRSFLGGSLELSLRGFDYEIRNYQIERSFSAADYFVASAPRARSDGLEARASWRPSPSWSITGNLGLQDVRLITFQDPLTGRNFGGNRAPDAPSFTAGLEVAFHSPNGWFVSAQASGVGRTFYSEAEDDDYSQGAYLLLGARAGVDSARWKLTFYVQNAADKGYYTLIIPGVGSGAAGAPRTEGAEVALKF